MATVQIDNKPRTLKFRFQDVTALERDLGCGVDELQRRGQRLVALVALLYYGLRHEDAALTQPQIEKKLDRYIARGGDLIPIVEAVYGALYESGVYGTRLADTARRVQADEEPTATPSAEEDAEDGPLPPSSAPPSSDRESV